MVFMVFYYYCYKFVFFIFDIIGIKNFKVIIFLFDGESDFVENCFSKQSLIKLQWDNYCCQLVFYVFDYKNIMFFLKLFLKV